MTRALLRRPATPADGTARLTPGRARRLVRAVVTGVVTGAAVVVLALLVREHWSPLADLDQRAVAAGAAFAAAHPAVLHALTTGQAVLQPTNVVAVGVVAALVFWWRTGQATRSWWAIATMLAAWGLANLVKELVRRARPVLDQPVETVRGYSFPSGHAANVASVTTTLVLLVWPVLRTRALRVAAVTGAAAITVLTAADRVLLGAHFPTDVLAGAVFGAGFAIASYLGFRHWPTPRPEAEHPTGPVTDLPTPMTDRAS